jgi:alpha-tubulin suppressor-like RCC1 family protein
MPQMSYHTVFNTTDGIYVCGYNEFGQLGLGHNIHRNIPTLLDFKCDVIGIYCGTYHTIFDTVDGIFVCGANGCLQLGFGDRQNRNIPAKLPFDHDDISIHCGSFHTIIRSTDGIYCYGNNSFGQLGLGDYIDISRNTPPMLIFYYEVISIHCGCDHTIFNTTDGIFVWSVRFR